MTERRMRYYQRYRYLKVIEVQEMVRVVVVKQIRSVLQTVGDALYVFFARTRLLIRSAGQIRLFVTF